MAYLCRGGGEGGAHGGHANDDEVDEAVAVGGEEQAVEGEVVGDGGVAYEGLARDVFVAVDDGGFEVGVRLLWKGAEQLAGDVLVDIEEALGYLGGVAAEMAHGVPAGYVEAVVVGFVVFAEDEDVGGQLYLAGAQRGLVGALAVVDDKGDGASAVGEVGEEVFAQLPGVAFGEDEDGLALDDGETVGVEEEVDDFAAAAKDEDVVFEIVAGESFAVVIEAVGKDDGEDCNKEGCEGCGADNGDECLEEEGKL